MLCPTEATYLHTAQIPPFTVPRLSPPHSTTSPYPPAFPHIPLHSPISPCIPPYAPALPYISPHYPPPQGGAHVYVCGDAKHMAVDVHQALLRILEEKGGKSPSEAAEYMSGMEAADRYQRDVWVTWRRKGASLRTYIASYSFYQMFYGMSFNFI